MHCNGLKLSGVLEEFSMHSRFLGAKMQKSIFFKKISVLSAFFLSNSNTGDCNLPSRLEKTQNT